MHQQQKDKSLKNVTMCFYRKKELPRGYKIKLVTSAILTMVSDLWIFLLGKVRKEWKRMEDMRSIWQIKVLKYSYTMKVPKLSRKLAYICGEKTSFLYYLFIFQSYVLWKSSWPFSSLASSWNNLSINCVHHYIGMVLCQLAPSQHHSSNRKRNLRWWQGCLASFAMQKMCWVMTEIKLIMMNFEVLSTSWPCFEWGYYLWKKQIKYVLVTIKKWEVLMKNHVSAGIFLQLQGLWMQQHCSVRKDQILERKWQSHLT